tara:strand:+ start:6016 stop:6297 length:282 start_codon:yes stop_codon:yes gene_type:complete
MSSQQLEDLVEQIQDMPKHHHIEILRIIKKANPTCSISENKNGSFINMNELNEDTLSKVRDYVTYNENQEQALDAHETMKNTIIESMNQSSIN